MTRLITTSVYEEHAVAGPAAVDLACTWTGLTGADGGYTDRILPDGCVDVIWDGTRVFVAGPDTGPVPANPTPGQTRIGVRFRPGHAPRYLGVPTSEVLDQRVDLADLCGDALAAHLADALSGVGIETASARLVAMISAMRSETTTSAVAIADEIVRYAPFEPVDALADRFGYTSRTLHRRCIDAFGYGAKTLQRVLRFRRFLALAECDRDATLGILAADAGYADQSHLARECNALSGLSPSALLVPRGVRSVQDTAEAAGAR